MRLPQTCSYIPKIMLVAGCLILLPSGICLASGSGLQENPATVSTGSSVSAISISILQNDAPSDYNHVPVSLRDNDKLPRSLVVGLALDPVEDGPGARVVLAPDHQPAGRAGIREGDIILEMNGVKVEGQGEVGMMLRTERPSEIRFLIVRDGSEQIIVVHPEEVPRLESPDYDIVYGTVVTDAGVTRRTLIRKPHGEGPFPAIVMLGGIGCYSLDRPGGIAYTNLLDELTLAGYLTYWVEKSGMGDSQGEPCMEIDFNTELSGYRAGLAQVRTMADVDQDRIILIGHSIGGITGPVLASEAANAGEKLHAVVAMSTVGVPWFEYLVANSRRQLNLSSLSHTEIEEVMREAVTVHYMYTIEKRSPAEILELYPARTGNFQLPHHYTYFQQVADYSPMDLWSRSDTSVLMLAGGADYVISTEEHRYVADNLNRLRPGSASFLLIDDLDHGLRQSRDYAAARSGEQGPFHPGLTRAIVEWLGAR